MDQLLRIKRIVTTFFLIALLFIVLGTGNLVYGTFKLNQYVQILNNIQAENINRRGLKKFSVFKYEEPLNFKQKDLEKIQSRISFYELVKLGGKSFLGVAGVFLLLCLLYLKQPGKTEAENL